MAFSFVRSLARALDPRRSLASTIGWLVFALSIGLVTVASLWVGDVLRTNLLDQRGRQMERSADRIAAELNLDLSLRAESVRALAAMLVTEIRDERQATLQAILDSLQRASPEFDRIVVANARGRVLAAVPGAVAGENVAGRAWFSQGLKASRTGNVQIESIAAKALPGEPSGASGRSVELIAPVIDAGANAVGVIGAQLRGRWLFDRVDRLIQDVQAAAGTQVLLLDQDHTVLAGADGRRDKRWESVVESAAFAPLPQVERLADGSRYLVARASPVASGQLHALGWSVVVIQPWGEATWSNRTLRGHISAVLLGLGFVAALLGAVLARSVTRDLDAIARSADAVRTGATQTIVVPAGRNEAARLARALDELLTKLQRERTALQTLNAELDRRVASRTREIERLAEQARYDAVVRERLKIARDLHDTLAHSMMAMLTEIRLLKRLSAIDPGAVPEELIRAEEAARQGLSEARAAIAHMRFNPVRAAGLGAALDEFVSVFVERTGIVVEFTCDAHSRTFADERAETLFRIAEEGLRNVERHSGATHAAVTLRDFPEGRGLTLTIIDDGIGFDLDAARDGHYGLAGLREQAQLIRALLTIDSARQRGTTISVSLALDVDS